MIEKALKYIMGFRDTEITEHNGFKYSSRILNQMPEDEPKIFSTKTLASLVELINKEHSHGALNDLVIHVDSPTKVSVYTTLRDHLDRFSLYSAVAELPNITLDRYLDLEGMNIMLKSTFIDTEAKDKLITLLGNIQEEDIQTTTDDGFSQKVVAKTGIATVSKVTINPIVKLAPFRTFIEVAQPESEFLLRLRKGPEAALFEADGGAWKLQARKNIKAYFEANLVDLISQGRVIVTE
jgi:hypothetical protein